MSVVPVTLTCDFYPRPPRGGRRWYMVVIIGQCNISIHALREEGDDGTNPKENQQWHFYPRPPRGGRLARFLRTRQSRCISIHALREEGDQSKSESGVNREQFLSTPSARRATYRLVKLAKFDEFLSTPSARRATSKTRTWRRMVSISIHALREEGDSKNRDKISIFKQIIQHSARI